MSNFIEQCLHGTAHLADIDDFIDLWNEEESNEPLYSYLGMTRSEYASWVLNPDVLPHIVNAHRFVRNDVTKHFPTITTHSSLQHD